MLVVQEPKDLPKVTSHTLYNWTPENRCSTVSIIKWQRMQVAIRNLLHCLPASLSSIWILLSQTNYKLKTLFFFEQGHFQIVAVIWHLQPCCWESYRFDCEFCTEIKVPCFIINIFTDIKETRLRVRDQQVNASPIRWCTNSMIWLVFLKIRPKILQLLFTYMLFPILRIILKQTGNLRRLFLVWNSIY